MSSPTLALFIAFEDDWYVSNGDATWTDIASYLDTSAEISIRRGRNHERSEIEAGTMTFRLRNRDRRFDPNNTSGPYFPDVVPMRKIRLQATWDSVDYWMYSGFVESWKPQYEGGTIAYVDVACVDAFKLFLMYEVSSDSAPQMDSGARIEALLDVEPWPPDTDLLWPAGDRAVAVGDVDIQEQTNLVTTVLGHMQAVARTEGGTLFMSKAGNVTFEDQSYRSGLSSVATFSDDAAGGDLPYAGLEVSNDDSDIWNYVSVTRDGGLTQHAADEDSQRRYGWRRLVLSNLLFVDDTAAAEHAELMLARYKDARTRPERFTIDPGVREVWAEVLDLEISDVVTIERETLLGGSVFSIDAHIEAIEWRIQKEKWLTSWELSPVLAVTPGTPTLRTGTRWSALDYETTWGDSGGGEAVGGYWKDSNGWVYLRGMVDGDSLGSTIAILPVGYRPPYNTRATIAADGGLGAVRVEPDGDIVLLEVPSGWASPDWIDLAGVTFRVD